MPAIQSKITLSALNRVKAEHIDLTIPRKDRNIKRKNAALDDRIKQKKRIVPDLDLRSLLKTPLSKNKKAIRTKDISIERPSKTTSSAVTAANKARKRQIEIGNAYSKLNSQVQNQSKTLECSKTMFGEIKESESVFFFTPREKLKNSEMDFENINPNGFPENFHESELDEFIRTQYPDYEQSSEYDLQDPLNFEDFELPQETFQPENSLRHFKELLEQEEKADNKLLEQSELALLKDIVKADERYQKLKKDDYHLLREILMGQLKEISQQERVIKIALEKIRCRSDPTIEVETIKVAKPEKPLEHRSKSIKTASIKQNSVKTKTDENLRHRQEVDVFFKNVPSLQKEIQILRSLGRKLEETLKKSNEEKSTLPLILYTAQLVSFTQLVSCASSMVIPFASKTIIGLAKEYKISHQTIDELKLERDFYIATDLDNFTLQRTNFDILRHNPQLLLRRLKPFTKDSRVKFNFIEQDPLFFNHFLAKMCNISTDSIVKHSTFIPKSDGYTALNTKLKMIPSACGAAGDHIDLKFNEENASKSEVPIKKEESRKTFVRKKSKQSRTPIEHNKKEVSAKNHLLKTILLGSLHFSIIVTVFTAIFYPDIICL